MNKLLWVFIGGGLGSLLRFGLAEWIPAEMGEFPWHTFWANVVASLILGIATGYYLAKPGMDERIYLFIMVGLCGGFSTFSTFSKETLQLVQQGALGLALAYVVSSVLICVLAVYLGVLGSSKVHF